jgi:integrase
MPRPHPYKAADGTTTWRVRFHHGGRNTSETFATEREALVFCADVSGHGADYAVKVRESAASAPRHSPTLDDVFEEYMVWRTPHFRSSLTPVEYRRRYDGAIRPALGHRTVASIGPADIAAFIDGLVAGKGRSKPLTPKSISDRHGLLHGILKFAALPGRDYIATDPCAGIDLPKRLTPRPRGLRPAEWHAIYAALATIDLDAADIAEYMLATGWRWQEASALSTYDVEDDGYTVHVTMARVVRRESTGLQIVNDAKSESGYRRTAVDDDCADMLRRRIAATTPGALVFTTPTGAMWRHSHFMERYWNPALAACNLSRRVTPHALRHTHVGWALMAGAAMPEIQARIGHAHISTTIDVYGRMLTDVQRPVLDKIAAARRPTVSSSAPLPAASAH